MKKILIIIIFIGLLFGFWQTAQALLVDYPDIPGAEKLQEGSTLPEIIKYIYMFALGAVGIVALASILIGALKYVTSAGSSDKIKDAKEQITSALLGVLILLASVMILRTINPDLLELKVGTGNLDIKPKEEWTTKANYGCYCCYTKNCDPLNPLQTQWSCYRNINYIEALGLCTQECKRISTPNKYLKAGVRPEKSCPSKTPQ